MNISYNWLKEYVNFDLTPDETAAALTSIGLETGGVEEVQTIKGGLEGLVIGEVLTCVEHPNSDHLHITTVNLGDGEPVQIVCGAPNVAAGQKVVVATLGTKLYDGDECFTIKKSKIRGVESTGMICAEDEIGIGTDHAGIIVLPAEAVPGTLAKDYYNIKSDYVLEVDITPNRADACSHYGVARDLYAYLIQNGKQATLQRPSVDAFKVENHDLDIEVTVENSEACPHYAGVTVKGVTVKESPEWLQNKLRLIGVRPINNVVDITNYIVHAFGQPLHCFDAGKIKGNEVIVKTMPEGTPFVTLDEVERKLNERDLMICNKEEAMCIAGVFGGLDSGSTEATTDVFIESAYFNPVWVRKTAKRFGLNTDSSFRFERGVDPDIQVYALKRAALLMKELAGGEIASEITDICSAPIEKFKVELDIKRVNRLIGKEIPADTIRTILGALDIKIEAEEGDLWRVAVPPYRVDVTREADLVEEILRIYGYNNIPVPSHVNSALSYAPKPDRNKLMNLAADFLTANGFTEIMSNSLTKAAYYEGLTSYKPEHCVKILNPLSNDLNVMRQTLLFNMLEAVQLNANHRNGDLKLYEFGNCYFYDATAAMPEEPLKAYSEQFRLAIAVTGIAAPLSWNRKPEQASFFTLRAIAEKLLRRFGLDLYTLKSESLRSDLYGDALSFSLNDKARELVQMGVVSSKLRKTFDLKQDVYYLEMDFGALVKATRKNKVSAKELSKFPEVKRDLALLIDKEVTFSALRDIAFAAERKLLKRVSLFDVYEGDKLPEGKKSYALSFVLEDKTQTLTDKMIEQAMANLTAQFERKAGAQVRA